MSFLVVGSIAAGAGALGTIGSGIIQSNAAGSAADKQLQAARESNALQQKIYDQTRSDQEPWRQAGVGALSGLANSDFQRDFTAADFQQDPGYAFRMAEGQKALERSAAARGGLQTGGTMKALTKYGQDFASNEFQRARDNFNADRDRRFGRLSQLAGIGQTANSAVGAAGQNYAGNVGNNTMGAANAAGAAGIAQANAYGGTLSGLGKVGMDTVAMGMQNSWMDRQLKGKGV